MNNIICESWFQCPEHYCREISLNNNYLIHCHSFERTERHINPSYGYNSAFPVIDVIMLISMSACKKSKKEINNSAPQESAPN
jgi:hypothetical protein